MNTEKRESLGAEYKWRMQDIYENTDLWEQALSKIQGMTDEVAACEGKLSETGKLAHCLHIHEQLCMQIERVYMYAKMQLDLDNSVAASQSMHDRALGMLFRAQEATAFLIPEMTAMEPNTLRSIIEQDNSLQDFRHMVENIIRSREHILSTREEQLMAMAAPALESIESAFSMLDSVDLKRGEILDEKDEKVTLTDGLFGRFRESPNRRVRADAFSTLLGAFAGMGNTIASLYAGQVRADVFAARARGYQSSLDAALFSDALPRTVYTELIHSVRESLPVYYRYLQLRKKLLGVDELHIYDCYVPIVDMPRKEYTYEQARQIVRDHLHPLGEQYLKDLDTLLAGGWVDVYETPHKTTGAYATGVYGVHPYMLLNFTGELGDIFTLAHEAGHCLHTYYSDTQPYTNKDYPIFLAEIASTVNENILMRGMIADCNSTTDEGRKEKAFLLNRYLEEFRGTVYRQTMFAEFELKVHEMAEKGEPLTGESLCGVYHNLLVDYFGPDVVIDAYMDWEWARIPHFYNAFYVFKYSTGFSAATAITQELLSEYNRTDINRSEVDRYLTFLHAGGSDYPNETLKRAGVDLSTPKPVQEALQEFSKMVDELTALLA